MDNNWQQVKEIFARVLDEKPENRARFIVEKCSGDRDLEQEIESLLSSYNETELFLESPAVAEIAEDFANQPQTLQPGHLIKHYRIIEKIGKGGMGEVFLAQDTRLERKVAIKILGDYFGDNRENLMRFMREAKTASSLNHPNIVIIHEIDESEGKNFIVSEFIEGLTLTELIQRKKLSLTHLTDISIQIVKALVAAHTVGIIHRDIKPDNVMIREDGLVKVLDFGLAKLVEKNTADFAPNENTLITLNTRSGLILGTVSYMSPEQTRGKDIDKPTDIWSFGVLLYQTLTGKLPFEGETTSDLIAAILKSEAVPVTKLNQSIPAKIELIVEKCLKKDPKERFSSVVELLDNLRAFQGKLKNGQKTEPLDLSGSDRSTNEKDTNLALAKNTARDSENAGSIPKDSFISQTFNQIQNRPAIALASILFCILTILVGYLGWSTLNSANNPPNSLQKMRLFKLTYEGRSSSITAISPDGKYIVYALNDNGKESLLVRQVNLDGVAEIISPAEVKYRSVTFSPDGNSIYYTVSKNDAVNDLYEISVLGGSSRKILNDIGKKITFSPDGKNMAYVVTKNSIMISGLKGESPQLLTTCAPGSTVDFLTWRPDGKTLIGVVYGTDEKFRLSEFSLANGSEKEIPTPPWISITGVKFLADGSKLILVGRDADTQFSQIWSVSFPDGETKRITNDLYTYSDLSITADDTLLVTVKEERLFNIWTVPGGKTEKAEKTTVDEGKDEGIAGVGQTSDGKIIYTIRKTGMFDLWIVNADGSNNHQFVSNQNSSFMPTASPDGKFIAFTSRQGENSNIWRVNVDGTDLRTLKDTPELREYHPRFSPDGKWLFYTQLDQKKLETIWKMNLESNETIQLTDFASSYPVVSPDGKTFACKYLPKLSETEKIAIIPADGGKPTKVFDFPGIIKSRTFRWSSDGKSLIYINKNSRAHNLWSQPLDDSSPKPLTFFESGQIWNFEIANDGQSFILSRGNESSDILMINDFK